MRRNCSTCGKMVIRRNECKRYVCTTCSKKQANARRKAKRNTKI